MVKNYLICHFLLLRGKDGGFFCKRPFFQKINNGPQTDDGELQKILNECFWYGIYNGGNHFSKASK